MPDWIWLTLAFTAGWLVCTLNAALQRGLDRLFTPSPTTPMDPELRERLRAHAFERHQELQAGAAVPSPQEGRHA